MGKFKKGKIIILFCAGLILLFSLSFYLGFPTPVIKALLLLLLMLLFTSDQDPLVVGICGGLGLLLLGMVGIVGYHFNTSRDYIMWAIEFGMYTGVYLFCLLFCFKLKRLSEISNLHEMVIAGTTAGLWQWEDMTKEQQWWSPRYYEMLGYENNEIPATQPNLVELIHPDDRATAIKVVDDYVSGKRIDIEGEYRLRTKSGEYKWFLGSGAVQFDKDSHRISTIVGSIVNIDHKKKYELKLVEQASLLALSPNAIIVTDENFNVVSWNEGAEHLYDIKAADAVGQNISKLYVNTYSYSSEQEVMEQLRENGIWRGEANQTNKKGKKVYVLSAIKMVKDGIGTTTGAVIVNSDISLLRLNNELSTALKMVENSTQYMEQLAYISSHDLKSPIVTLQGLMNYLATSKAIQPGYEATFEMLREIVEQMKSTSMSLNSILQLRKNLTSRDFATDNISLNQVMKDVTEMLKTQISASGAQIDLHIEKGLQVRMHHNFLKTILYNLLSNSIKFKHPDRIPEISVEAKLVSDSVIIVVNDNGLGMNLARIQNKLFTIFTRFHEGVEGNGVGLHSVKMIVDFYKGEIKVESEEGKGTRITIKLPVASDGEI